VLAEPALIEGVERTNIVIVCLNQWAELVLCNLYAMEVDHENRNCYICGGFGHLARNCRNRGIGGRIREGKLEYRGNNEQRKIIEGENGQSSNNLNGDGDLIVSN